MVVRAPPAQPDDVEWNKVWEAIFEIMGVHRGSVEVTKMIRELQGTGVRVDKVHPLDRAGGTRIARLSKLVQTKRSKLCWYQVSW